MRKTATLTKNDTSNASSEIASDHQEQETVSLKFEEAEDVVEPEKPSRVKAAFKQVFTTTDEEEANAKKPRKKKSTFFVKNVELVVGGMLFCIHLLVPENYKETFYVNETAYQYLPTEKQLSEIITPLARIADRHTHIADINPDILDVLACGQACAVYGMELRATIILKAHIDKKAKQEEKVQNNEMWRNRINGLGNEQAKQFPYTE